MKSDSTSKNIQDDLYNYLFHDLGLTKEAIELGLKHSRSENAPLPIVLWSFGLITGTQYQDIIKWSYNK